MFHSTRTVESRDIQYLAAILISSGIPSVMKLILPNITERKHGVV